MSNMIIKDLVRSIDYRNGLLTDFFLLTEIIIHNSGRDLSVLNTVSSSKLTYIVPNQSLNLSYILQNCRPI